MKRKAVKVTYDLASRIRDADEWETLLTSHGLDVTKPIKRFTDDLAMTIIFIGEVLDAETEEEDFTPIC